MAATNGSLGERGRRKPRAMGLDVAIRPSKELAEDRRRHDSENATVGGSDVERDLPAMVTELIIESVEHLVAEATIRGSGHQDPPDRVLAPRPLVTGAAAAAPAVEPIPRDTGVLWDGYGGRPEAPRLRGLRPFMSLRPLEGADDVSRYPMPRTEQVAAFT